MVISVSFHYTNLYLLGFLTEKADLPDLHVN